MRRRRIGGAGADSRRSDGSRADRDRRTRDPRGDRYDRVRRRPRIHLPDRLRAG